MSEERQGLTKMGHRLAKIYSGCLTFNLAQCWPLFNPKKGYSDIVPAFKKTPDPYPKLDLTPFPTNLSVKFSSQTDSLW